jgi:prepilin-type N-terminal cleavage/methylation domain-containing protein
LLVVPKRVLQAFTLLELLIVIGVIAILTGIMFPVVSTVRARAQRVQCMSNLRNLHVAANLYVQQNGSWPQILVDSDDDGDGGQPDYARAWIAALAPFGLTQKAWICPTIQGLLQNPDYFQPENARVDYYAMPFDDKPTTPYQWPRQPWFVEKADVHGNGNLIIFTDGSISDLKSVLRNPGK